MSAFMRALLAGELYEFKPCSYTDSLGLRMEINVYFPPSTNTIDTHIDRLIAEWDAQCAAHDVKYHVDVRTMLEPRTIKVPLDPERPWSQVNKTISVEVLYPVITEDGTAGAGAGADAVSAYALGISPGEILLYNKIMTRIGMIDAHCPYAGDSTPIARREHGYRMLLWEKQHELEARFVRLYKVWLRRRHLLAALRP
jgi:hypothetical protein